ncbi:predicted acetyl-CoA carboxylase [Prevotella sp. CAG:485]|nr:predicted acetyl-CoA carboxylase [Prevotella sp. CAG:485]
MQNNGIVFLACAGQEAGNVYQRYQRNVEAVAEANEAGCLARSVAVQYTGKHFRLVGNHTYALTVHAGEAHDDVLGIVALYFQELAVVDDGTDNVIHIVRTFGVIGNYLVEFVLQTVDRVGAFLQRGLFHIVLGHERDEFADELESLFTCLGGEVRNTALAAVNAGAAQFFLAYVLARNGLNNRGAGEEHIADTLGHDGKVGESRAVNSAACTRTEDSANLRNYARCQNVALENLGVACQSVDAFLNTSAARVVQTDYRSAHGHGQIHYLADFLCHGFRQRAAEYGEVLCENIYQTAFNCAVAGYYTIAKGMFLVLAEVGATVCYKHIQLLKRTLVKELGNAFAGGVFAACMLFFNSLFAAAEACLSSFLKQFLKLFLIGAHVMVFCQPDFALVICAYIRFFST